MATESLSYSGFYFSTPVATTTVANTPTKCLGTTSSTGTNNFTNSVNNRSVFDGSTARTFCVIAPISVSSSGATQSKFFIYKNGTVVAGSEIQRKIGTGGDVGAMAIGCLVSLSKNDYLELWCETDDGDTLTVQSGGVIITVAG